MKTTEPEKRESKWTAAVLVSIGVFIALLDTTIVDIVLPKMMSAMEADIYSIQWVVITYFLGAAISMTAVGWVAERAGHRNMYLAGVLLFTAMSALAGVAENLPIMLTARFVQGVAEGIMVPVGLVILYESFPKEERGLAMGIYGLSASFAPALGPTLGGFLTEYLNWRWVFFINLPFGIADAILVWFLMRSSRADAPARPLDVMGFVLMSAALSCLIVFLGKGQENGWLHSDYVFGLFVFFILFGAAAVAWFVFCPNPLFPRRLLANPHYWLGLVTMILLSVNAYGFFFLIPVYLERLHSYSTLQAGLIMVPGALTTCFATIASGLLSDRVKPKWVCFFFLAGATLASLWYRTDLDTPHVSLVYDYIFWGFCVGGTFTPVILLSLAVLDDDDVANGSTLLNVVRLIAGSVGTSFATSLLSSRRDIFYDALSSNMLPGSYAANAFSDMLRSLVPQSGAYADPSASAAFRHLGHELIASRAYSFAFEATFQYLALFMLAAAIVVIWVRSSDKKVSGPVH